METSQVGKEAARPVRDWRARRRDRIARWFTEHRATLTTFTAPGAPLIESLRWAKPGTGAYSVNYQTYGHRLFVSGDIGYAIYVVSEVQPLEFWASCDLGYFASKCVASPEGREYRVWDAAAAKAALRESIREFSHERREQLAETGAFTAIDSAYAWSEWIGAHGGTVWGDAWEFGDLGKVVAQECEAHLAGLKLAMAQLRAGTVAS